MKRKKFQQANSKCEHYYISNSNNVVVMKFRPSFWELCKMICRIPVWVAAPIVLTSQDQSRFIVKVKHNAFRKGKPTQ